MYTTKENTYNINITKTVEVVPTNRQKSFYGKAKEITDDAGNVYLQSYETIVCGITASGIFNRLWDGYSKTTMLHVIAFCDAHGISCGGAQWWKSLLTHTL